MKSTSIKTFLNDLAKEGSNKNFDFCYVKEGRYYNDLFGISFKIPNEWYIVSMENYDEAIDKQTFVGEYEHYKDELEAFQEHPSFMVTKHDPNSDKYYGLVSPTLNFSIIAKSPDYEDHSLKDYADLIDSQDGFGYPMLKKFRVTNKSDVFSIKGFDYIRYDTEYLFEHKELEFGIMVELSILNIDFGDFFLDFSMTDCKEQNQVETEIFNEIINSLELKK